MNKSRLVVGLVAMLMLSSCATVDVEKLSHVKNTAILSVYASKSIDMTDFTGLASVVSKLVQNDKFDLKPVAAKIKDSLFSRYQAAFPFKFIPEEQILNSPRYQQLKATVQSRVVDFLRYNDAPRYTTIFYDDATMMTKLLQDIPGADAGLVVQSEFKLKKQGEFLGFGTAKMATYLTIVLRNRQQEDITSVVIFGESKNSLRFSLGGVFDASQLQPLCMEATEDALIRFDSWIRDNIAKYDFKNKTNVYDQAYAAAAPAATPKATAAVSQPAQTAAAPQSTAPVKQTAAFQSTYQKPLQPRKMNSVAGRKCIYGTGAENQFVFTDFNRIYVQYVNDELEIAANLYGADSSKMPEVKRGYSWGVGADYGLTDWLIVGGEYNELYVHVEGSGSLINPDTGVLHEFNARLDLPTRIYEAHVKLAVPLGERLLFTLGGGLEYISLDGGYYQETVIDHERRSYGVMDFIGETMGYRATMGLDFFWSENVAMAFDMGYRQAFMTDVYDRGEKIVIDNRPLQVNYEGLLFRAGVKIWI